MKTTKKGRQMNKNILDYALWWICGAMCGLSIAQLLVADETISMIILAITSGLLIVDIVVFIIQMRRVFR